MIKKPPSLTQIQLKKQKEQLLDTQELAANLYEENTSLKSQLLDTQAIVATLAEGGTV